MKRRKHNALMLGAAALCLALLPTGASADHCKDILVFTGYNDDVLPENTTTTGHLNAGSAGCTVAAVDEDTNYILPGSTHVRVDAQGTPAQPASNGAIRFDDGPWEEFAWHHPGGVRWRSPIMEIPEGTTRIRARGTTTNSLSGPKTETVTYVALV